MSFTMFQKEKTPFQAIKTRSSKSRKIDIFPKELTHGFGPKMAIFPIIFFRQYRQGKCSLLYSRTKNAFLGNKKKKFKNSKNCHFSKGFNPWFQSENGHFSNFCFRQYRPGKCSLRYCRSKKRLSRLYKQELQKVEKLTFFQRV